MSVTLWSGVGPWNSEVEDSDDDGAAEDELDTTSSELSEEELCEPDADVCEADGGSEPGTDPEPESLTVTPVVVATPAARAPVVPCDAHAAADNASAPAASRARTPIPDRCASPDIVHPHA
ncbi:MAG: hypothetical protein ACJ786_07730 [Catenulispora sp.]